MRVSEHSRRETGLRASASDGSSGSHGVRPSTWSALHSGSQKAGTAPGLASLTCWSRIASNAFLR
eukprot:7680466-Alexandrium_andersonii.AAC.1